MWLLSIIAGAAGLYGYSQEFGFGIALWGVAIAFGIHYGKFFGWLMVIVGFAAGASM